MVTPARKTPIVTRLITHHHLSERTACRLVGLSRTAYRYQRQPERDQALRSRLQALATESPRYGSLLLHGLLKAEGLVTNKKHTYRLYREANLQVRTKARKKIQRPRLPLAMPTKANQRWSMDFVSDQLANGRRFRVLNVVDDCTREVVGPLVAVRHTRPASRSFPRPVGGAPATPTVGRLRQRSRVHKQGAVLLGKSSAGALGLHSTGQTYAERVGRKPQWEISERVSQLALVPLTGGRTARNRAVADTLQLRPTA